MPRWEGPTASESSLGASEAFEPRQLGRNAACAWLLRVFSLSFLATCMFGFFWLGRHEAGLVYVVKTSFRDFSWTCSNSLGVVLLNLTSRKHGHFQGLKHFGGR